MKPTGHLFSLLLALLTLLSLCMIPSAAETADEITILFTHDLHSHILPSANETGDGEYGGYARLMTVIRRPSPPTPFWWTAVTSPWALCSRPPTPPRPLSCG